MEIQELWWNEQVEDHIARHNVRIEDVEEVCFQRNWMIRSGRRRRAVFGQSAAGRYLLVILDKWDYGEFDVVTARDMKQAERRR